MRKYYFSNGTWVLIDKVNASLLGSYKNVGDFREGLAKVRFLDGNMGFC